MASALGLITADVITGHVGVIMGSPAFLLLAGVSVAAIVVRRVWRAVKKG